MWKDIYFRHQTGRLLKTPHTPFNATCLLLLPLLAPSKEEFLKDFCLVFTLSILRTSKLLYYGMFLPRGDRPASHMIQLSETQGFFLGGYFSRLTPPFYNSPLEKQGNRSESVRRGTIRKFSWFFGAAPRHFYTSSSQKKEDHFVETTNESFISPSSVKAKENLEFLPHFFWFPTLVLHFVRDINISSGSACSQVASRPEGTYGGISNQSQLFFLCCPHL